MKNTNLVHLKSIAVEAGWRVRATKGGHWQFFSPDKKTIILVSGSPGDYRAQAKSKADFKRAGLAV